MKDLTDWDMTKCFPTEYEKLVKDLWFNPRLWNRVQPVLDSRFYLDLLCKEENVFVATDTHWDILPQKVRLLQKCFPCINTDNIYTCKNKQKLSFDVLTDDAVHNLFGGKYHKILMSYRWNQNFNCSKNGIHRSDDFIDVYKEIQRIKEAKRSLEEITN